MGKRYGLFYAFGAVPGAFAGIMAFRLAHMHGISGMDGWRWLFIIERVLACVAAFLGYWLLINLPNARRNNWRFLSNHERAWVVARINADRGDAKPTHFSLQKFTRHMLDIKVLGFGLLFFCCSTQGYAMSFFTPIILTSGWIGDKYKLRGPLIVFNYILSVIGLSLMGSHKALGVWFFGIFLTAA
ncbi:MFS domain-containing protein [Fusarium sp. Ph1]|nr:MFS domain-containing protein [Fusarium sp. Ph1]